MAGRTHDERREGRVEKVYASQQTDGEKNMEVKDTLEMNERELEKKEREGEKTLNLLFSMRHQSFHPSIHPCISLRTE